MKSAAIHPFAQALARVCHSLYQRGYAPGRTGNVSGLHEGLLWTTPSGWSMQDITPESLIQIWPDGRMTAEEGLTATSEMPMHRSIYEARPDVGAVVHAHPPKSTALAVAHQALEQPILSEIITTLRAVPLVPFHPPGSQALGDAVAGGLKTHDAVLLANHGVVAVGKTLEDAYYNFELVESFAEIYLLAKQFGVMHPLTSEQVAAMQVSGV